MTRASIATTSFVLIATTTLPDVPDNRAPTCAFPLSCLNARRPLAPQCPQVAAVSNGLCLRATEEYDPMCGFR
jgi:hypothetical protein